MAVAEFCSWALIGSQVEAETTGMGELFHRLESRTPQHSTIRHNYFPSRERELSRHTSTFIMSLGNLILELLRDIWAAFLFSIAGTGLILFFVICLAFLYGAPYAAVYGLFWIVYMLSPLILRLPTLTSELLLYLRRNFTVPPRRFAWQSLKGFADARTSLLSEPDCSISLNTLTTSALCQECFHVVSRSKLISGSILPFVRRVERHDWVLPLRVTE